MVSHICIISVTLSQISIPIVLRLVVFEASLKEVQRMTLNDLENCKMQILKHVLLVTCTPIGFASSFFPPFFFLPGHFWDPKLPWTLRCKRYNKFVLLVSQNCVWLYGQQFSSYLLFWMTPKALHILKALEWVEFWNFSLTYGPVLRKKKKMWKIVHCEFIKSKIVPLWGVLRGKFWISLK